MKLLDGRSEAFQWDSNIYAILKNINEGEEVHFAHRKDVNSLRGVVEIKDGDLVTKIPNILLQRAGFIQIYWFLQDKKGNRTIKREELKVLAKEKPEDYEYEGDEFLSYKTLDEKITNTNKRIDSTNEKISETKLEILGESGYNKTVKDSYELAESKPSKAEVKTEINSAINDFATKISDDGTVNTFKEMVDYASAHQGEYAALFGEVQKNSEKIDALNEGQNNLKKLSHTHSNKELLDLITVESVENTKDWAENDSTSKTYIKNRPGGYDIIQKDKEICSIPETPEDDSILLQDPYAFEEGAQYFVSFNGGEFQSYMGHKTLLLNEVPVHYIGTNTPEEILFGSDVTDGWILISESTDKGFVGIGLFMGSYSKKSFVCKGDVPDPIKIPGKYLDLASAKDIYWFNFTDVDNINARYIADKTFDEIAKAISAGKLVLARVPRGMVKYGQSDIHVGFVTSDGENGNHLECFIFSNKAMNCYTCAPEDGKVWKYGSLADFRNSFEDPKAPGVADCGGASGKFAFSDHVHPRELPMMSLDLKNSFLSNDGYKTTWVDLSPQIERVNTLTDDYINNLIDTKLGVIENGSY